MISPSVRQLARRGYSFGGILGIGCNVSGERERPTTLNGVGGAFRFGYLAFACSDNQSQDPSNQQNNSYSGRKFLARLGLNSDLSIANLDAMVLAVRYRHHERHKPEYQQYDTDENNVLHIETPAEME
jgi:hypothetical protein